MEQLVDREQKNGAQGGEVNETANRGAEKGVGRASGDEKGASLRNEAKKSPKTAVLIGVIVVLAMCLVGAVTWGVLLSQGNEGQSGNGDCLKCAEVDENQPMTGMESGSEIVELALNNALVQRLYHNFDGIESGRVGGAGPVREARFYVDEDALNGNPSRVLMAGVAMKAIPRMDYCSGWWANDPDYYAEGKIDYEHRLSSEGCYSGEGVRRKVKEMFGKDVEFQDGERATSNYCGSYKYSAKNDEFYSDAWGCGGSGGEVIERYLYKAEQSGQNIYLYEAVAVDTPVVAYRVLSPNAEGEIANKEQVVYDRECSDAPAGECKNGFFEISEHLDEVDHFRWTFTKTADGDYAFVGLERE